jgi:hypothetical protein
VEIPTANKMIWLLRFISKLMNEKKHSIDTHLHLINNDILIVGVAFAPALDGMSAAEDYEFLK